MRLFTALWPDDPLRDLLAQWQGSWQWPPRAAPVKAERLHLTLHFLGNVQADRIAPLRAALHLAFEPFSLQLGKPDIWGNGVAALLPHDTPATLLDLHGRMAKAITGVGLAIEPRPYRPHVTIARRAWHARPPAQPIEAQWRASSGFVLVQSLPGGAGYEIIERFGR
jgi:2'-5' RNA ligase